LENQPNANEVRFSTLHRYKGLEADVGFGISRKQLPGA